MWGVKHEAQSMGTQSVRAQCVARKVWGAMYGAQSDANRTNHANVIKHLDSHTNANAQQYACKRKYNNFFFREIHKV